jgi:hypothetical protein
MELGSKVASSHPSNSIRTPICLESPDTVVVVVFYIENDKATNYFCLKIRQI